MTYTPTRPIMGRNELAAHKVDTHGRYHGVADDGYDDMEIQRRRGWNNRASWGRNGWDLGDWPYVIIGTKTEGDRFLVQMIVEGDHTVYGFDTEADQHAAVDYLFLWYGARHDYFPLTEADRPRLDMGGFEVDAEWRGPCRPDEWPPLTDRPAAATTTTEG